MVVKSAHTFFVTPGETSKWQVECFYYNQTSKVVESISPCTQSTPKHLKRPFGAIKTFQELDSETYEIENFKGERLQLLFARLTPMLDKEDSHMKKALLSVVEKGCAVLVSILSELADNFKSYRKEDPPSSPDKSISGVQASMSCSQESGFGTQESTASVSGLTRSSSVCSVTQLGSSQTETCSQQIFSVKISEVTSIYDHNSNEAHETFIADPNAGDDGSVDLGGDDKIWMMRLWRRMMRTRS